MAHLLKYEANPASLQLEQDEFWAYGGDFGDYPNYGEFCIDGLIGANRARSLIITRFGKFTKT